VTKRVAHSSVALTGAELSVAEELASLPEEDAIAVIESMDSEDVLRVLYDWSVWARPKQIAPLEFQKGEKFAWLLRSGRGFGKSRVGAEKIREWVGGPSDPMIRVALIAETAADGRDVIVEGESGLLTISPPWNMPVYEPSKRRIVWPNGSQGILFSGDEPDQLRGPQFHKAWVDELAKYRYPQETWDNLEFALRLGDSPQAIITTTPRPIPIIKMLLEDPMVSSTVGSSYENLSNLAATYIQRVIRKYEGTRTGRQELHGEVLTDTPGALWLMEQIDGCVVNTIPDMVRIVVGIDPAMTAHEDSDETGIVVCGKGVNGFGYVLQDVSGRYTPGEWASKAIEMLEKWQGDKIVAEVNAGGDLVESTLRTVDSNVPFKKVYASRGKIPRAEPIAALYEQGKMRHFGRFPVMEDQMTTYTAEPPAGRGMRQQEMPSPDRMDAMVWAFTELMLKRRGAYDPAEWATYRR
jgi:phage terminase large subunit-like protein